MSGTKNLQLSIIMTMANMKILNSWFIYLALALIIIQHILLAYLSPLSGIQFWVILTLIIAVFLSCKLILERLSIPGLFENFSVSWSFGGLGMLLGHHFDMAASGHHVDMVHAGHQTVHNLSLMSFISSGMTVGMLMFCIPACVVFCNKKLVHLSQGSKCWLHIGSSAFMLIGMFIAVVLSFRAFSPSEHVTLFGHYFMLMLMVVFSNFAYVFIVSYLNCIDKVINETL